MATEDPISTVEAATVRRKAKLSAAGRAELATLTAWTANEARALRAMLPAGDNGASQALARLLGNLDAVAALASGEDALEAVAEAYGRRGVQGFDCYAQPMQGVAHG